MTQRNTRRRFLTTSGGLVTLALAGCAGDGGTGDEGEMDGGDEMNGDDETDGGDGMDGDNETGDDETMAVAGKGTAGDGAVGPGGAESAVRFTLHPPNGVQPKLLYNVAIWGVEDVTGAEIVGSTRDRALVFEDAIVSDWEGHETISDRGTRIQGIDLAGALIGAHTRLSNGADR